MNLLHGLQSGLQGLGRALMLPIAVLPIAGLILRLGQPDLLDIAFVAAAGSAIFDHLGLLFAIGVAVGLARENNGAAGLAGAVCFLVLMEGAKVLMPLPADLPGAALDPAVRDALLAAWRDKQAAKLNVPAGIVSGVAAGIFYNRFHIVRLPEYLSFFGGRRFVPIICGLFGLAAAAIVGLGFPVLEGAIDQLSLWITQSGSIGLFIYGAANRLLLVTGLHHLLNNIAWFVLGDFHGATGDLKRFFAGDPTAGAFMAGFFPVMMFGLPGACLAMWRAALPEKRRAVGGLFLSMALTSFLTGVTEPIEFTFMFLAPALYALHALLTGAAMVIMDLLGVKLGFGFSAGLLDYLLNFGLATRPLLLAPVGLAYFLIYYAAFSFVIRRFDLKTPGRSRDEDAPAPRAAASGGAGGQARAYVAALGGAANLSEIAACTTRLRLTLVDRTLIDEKTILALGARGVLAVGARGLQIIIGPDADRIASEMRAGHGGGESTTADAPVRPSTASTAPSGLGDLFGGAANIAGIGGNDQRMLVTLHDPALCDHSALDARYPERWFRSSKGAFHLLAE